MDQAVSGLAEDGKVICVRLALFADMMKGKQWTPGSLESVGGTRGVGSTFLEETFSAPSANPKRRLHQKAARAVLKALLPEQGTDIKGNMRSGAELLKASGYGDHPKDFDDLLRILDSEVRLITPTDPEGIDSETKNTRGPSSQKFYQLTHDYLVPSLRDWLTRKQKETLRGRAELRLAERTAFWQEKRESRHLPSLWEFLNIGLLTNKTKWSEPQRKMMRKAGRVHGTRCGIAAALAVAALFSTWEINGRFQAASLVKRLIAADIAHVPSIVQEMEGYRRWIDPLLYEQEARGSNHKLYLDLALVPVDARKIGELRDQLSLVSPSQFPVVRDALSSYKDRVTESLWNLAVDPSRETQQRFQAACALATYAPDEPRWRQIDSFVVSRLVTLEASALVAWREALRPAKTQIIKPLALVYRDRNQTELPRTYATRCWRITRLIDLRTYSTCSRTPNGSSFRCCLTFLQRARIWPSLSLTRNLPEKHRQMRTRIKRNTRQFARPMLLLSCSGLALLTRSGRCSNSVPIRELAATSFIGSARWEAIRSRLFSDSRLSPT
jgi:hypothetical protein